MPTTVSNLISKTLDEKEKNSIMDAIATLKSVLSPIVANLTIEDRRRYGSINEQNKLFVDKVLEFHKTNPEMQSPEVDWKEFENDYAMRSFIREVIMHLSVMTTGLENAKVLHDYDNYQDALNDYSYTNFRSKTAGEGFLAKYKELKKFFARTKKTSAQPAETTGDTPETNKG